jgi:hypothetical protein
MDSLGGGSKVLIIGVECSWCAEEHIISVTALGKTANCPKCGKEFPAHPKANTLTEGLLAAIMAYQRQQLTDVRSLATQQIAELRSLTSQVFWLRVTLGLVILVVLLFGLRVEFR